jgi:hypothetical protein
LRACGLVAALAAATATPLLQCAPQRADDPFSEEDAVGVDNKFGLGLRYDQATGTVQATLKQDLGAGEQVYVRVRRGTTALTSQKDVDCAAIVREGQALVGARDASGKIVFQGPAVDKSVIDLLHVYDDARWATGDVSQALKDDLRANGSVPIVEACRMNGDQFRAKLQVNLAYAWDQGTLDKQAGSQTKNVRIRSGEDGGAPVGLDENNVQSQIEYGQLCVDELGEIPFFKKNGVGKYDTFDCRNLVGTTATGSTGPIAGVEGAMIPVVVDGQAQTKCSPGKELGLDSQSYGCMDKADHGMFLATGDVQPGPMVVTAKNEKGTHWLLLCRKVADDGQGMTKTVVFNDMAMIGHNPRTGRTCFFQNSIGSGRDGAHVPHPADVEKSTSVWSTTVQSYCSGSCHAADPYVHSPWIDGAKRSDGTTVVPKMGENADFPISQIDAPYSIIAADHLGFEIPKQLVSDEVGACNNCHRLAGNTNGRFARWSTGTGDEYFDKITDTGKAFEASHWMPPRTDSVTAATWDSSKFGLAVTFMQKCDGNSTDPSCIWADVPRGAFNNPSTSH